MIHLSTEEPAATPLRLQLAAHAEIDFLLVSHMFTPRKATQPLQPGPVEMQNFVRLQAYDPDLTYKL
jgi:hypothetical protein